MTSHPTHVLSVLNGANVKKIDKDPKFQVGDHVRKSKRRNIFAKAYTPNWFEEVFVIKKVINTVPWTYVIEDPNGEEIFGTHYKEELQKTNEAKAEFIKYSRKKVIYVKW